jgi:hypothetical protein
MPVRYMPYDPDASLLLLPMLQESFPSAHLAHFISDTIDLMNLQAFHERYGTVGRFKAGIYPLHSTTAGDRKIFLDG